MSGYGDLYSTLFAEHTRGRGWGNFLRFICEHIGMGRGGGGGWGNFLRFICEHIDMLSHAGRIEKPIAAAEPLVP